MLLKLPGELRYRILQLLDLYDVIALCLVSRGIREYANAIAYRAITVSISEPLNLMTLLHRLQSLAEADGLESTKQICFTAPFHVKMYQRCPHYEAKNDADFKALDSVLTKILQKAEGLESFSWKLGCCMPESIWQIRSRVTSLTFLTDLFCPKENSSSTWYKVKSPINSFSMEKFTKLRSLDWRGLRLRDMQAFQAFYYHEPKLELRSLTLDMINWDKVCDQNDFRDISVPIFNDYLFDGAAPAPPFPFLEELQLTAVSLGADEEGLSIICCLDKLTKLKLDRCYGTMNTLHRIIKQDCKGLPLRWLELNICDDQWQKYKDSEKNPEPKVILPRFLDRLECLETLCLGIPSLGDDTDKAIANSITRLPRINRLAWHHTDISQDIRAETPGRRCLNLEWLRHLNLECLSLSIYEDDLLEGLRLVLDPPRCKMFHLRESWNLYWEGESKAVRGKLPSVWDMSFPNSEEPMRMLNLDHENIQHVMDAISFIFDTISEVQVVAFGDFSYGGRWSNSNILLCRDSGAGGFRPMRDSDTGCWRTVDSNMDVLASCSLDALIWSDSVNMDP